MRTTLRIENINRILDEHRGMAAVSSSPTSMYLLHVIRAHPGITLQEIESQYSFRSGTAKDWLDSIQQVGLIECTKNKYQLSALGQRKLALTALPLEKLGGREIPGPEKIQHKLPDSYNLDKELLGKGATSVSFRAIQRSTGRARTVKIFRPGLIHFRNLQDFREKRKNIQPTDSIPEFMGMGQFRAQLTQEEEYVALACQVFDYVNESAKTLHDYVNSTPPPDLSQDFFRHFVEHVGGALTAIEAAGLQHGDLHARNILVIPSKSRRPGISFKVIDLAGGSSFNSIAFSGISDLEMFKRHLLWCLSEVCQQRPGAVSTRELVGYAVERIIIGLREGHYQSFAEMLDDYYRPPKRVPEEYWTHPPQRPFEWIRVEMMPLEQLYLLFEPDEHIYREISGTDNVLMSGPRGCGKSHYLRTMSFSPQILKLAEENPDLKQKLQRLNYDVRRSLGVLFECRVGEFKNFTPDAAPGGRFSADITRRLKHILILKIVNKTLYLMHEGCEKNVLRWPSNILALRRFMKQLFPNMPLYGTPGPFEEIQQYTHALVTKEKESESAWNRPDKGVSPLLAEPDLDSFFRSLQHDFPDLAQTQFFVLVDDVSEGRMHFEMQKVLNSIMTSATRRYCFKITFDKYMYTLETVERRAVNPFQDVVYVDLGDLSVKAQRRKKHMREYIQSIVNARLRASYSTDLDIGSIFGNSQQPRDFLRLLRLPRKRKRRKISAFPGSGERQRALYAGWNIVWQLSHGSIRTLFQLLDHVFDHAGFDPQKEKTISPTDQDKWVRHFSKQKFQSLLMLKGGTDGSPIGTPVSDIARSIGEVSRLYLRQWKTGERGRYYETISLERLDRRPLRDKAADLLKALIEYDVLLIEGVTFSRAQVGLSERYDLNKIYSPCFEITYRVRNHLYLGKGRFEQLLLEPSDFVKKTRARLDALVKPDEQIQATLFEEE